MRRLSRVIPYLLFAVVLGLSLYLFVEKYRMGMFRYFDMDEWAYLNWASHMVGGALPYRDFIMQAGPGFIFLLAPLFWLSTSPLFPIFGARVLVLVLFFLLAVVISLLFFVMRKRWTAIFVLFLLVFLPMPADKFLEIRPDTLAFLLVMLGTLLEVFWMKKKPFKPAGTLLFFQD